MIRPFLRWTAWLLVCAVALFTLSPIELRPVTAAPANWERFAAFTAIGALLCVGYPQHRLRIVGLVIALAGLLEVLQHLSPTRHGRLPDGVVKAAGALLGIALATAVESGLRQLRLAAARAHAVLLERPESGLEAKAACAFAGAEDQLRTIERRT